MTNGASFGLSLSALGEMRALFAAFPGIERVWIFGSRARGDQRDQSDIDLAVDAPDMGDPAFRDLCDSLDRLPMLYKRDVVHWQKVGDAIFLKEIERDRQVFWEPVRYATQGESVSNLSRKPFQRATQDALNHHLDELTKHRAQSQQLAATLKVMEGADDLLRQARDYPKKTWDNLRKAGALPPTSAPHEHASRFDGAGEAIPNVCLKVPTGGGKTLLAASAVGQIFTKLLRRSTGLVLWVVPNEAIYRQTWKALGDRDHPYRQLLNVAGAGRVKLLDKAAPLTRIDVESHLCVLVLMLQSAARQSKETLKFFRDRGNVLGFFPREDDLEAHWQLLERVPNLDVYAPFGASAEEARATKGSIIKDSLGNVMRLVKPVVIMDEGHHAYTETALATLDGFNPGFLLELSATPRGKSVDKNGRTHGSNILVDVRGTDLDEAEMIKLPINVEVKAWGGWQACLAAAVERLDTLQREAVILQSESARYIRPILLVQVERTGRDQRDAGAIHAEDARAYLLQLGFSETQIAIKTSDQNDLKTPENIDLLSPTCEVRAIITKQALSEGWDCPFAYVLCALAAGRSLNALTQLVGRILRQPLATKTARPALNECHVLCHDAKTADVVGAIKKSLEGEGMGDLALAVKVEGDPGAAPRRHVMKRRAAFAKARIFLPHVTWVESVASSTATATPQRRALDYESDVLAAIDWADFDAGKLLADWAPTPRSPSTLAAPGAIDPHWIRLREPGVILRAPLDRARLVRSLTDIAPNPFWVWLWVDGALGRLQGAGFDESTLAASTASMIERMRVDVETERDRLAAACFSELVAHGRIEFALRADAADYELPLEFAFDLDGKPEPLIRDDARLVEKSLFEPFIRNGFNNFESGFACYLDDRAAVEWWHRNVAKRQYGLQGWKRDKVYPDFVFAVLDAPNQRRLVVLETKGAHLAGNEDAGYKRALMERLSAVFADKRGEPAATRAGSLELEGGGFGTRVVCDLLLDVAWQSTFEARHFAPQARSNGGRAPAGVA